MKRYMSEMINDEFMHGNTIQTTTRPDTSR